MRSRTAGLLLLLGLIGSATAASAADEPPAPPTVETYEITGRTLADLNREMKAKGPGDAIARSYQNWSYRTAVRSGKDGFKVERVEITVKRRTLLPRWRDYDRANPCMKETWDRVLESITKHENLHHVISLLIIDDMRKSLMKIPAQPTRAGLEKLVKSTARRVFDNNRAMQHKFDANAGDRVRDFEDFGSWEAWGRRCG